MKINKRLFILIAKVLCGLIIFACFAVNLIILKKANKIQDDLYYLESDINSIDYSVNNLEDSISDIQDDISDIKIDIRYLNY